MATEGKPVQDFPQPDYADWKASSKREAAWWDQARAAGRRFVKFPFADSFAVYEVRGEKRYTLHHVPAGDAWQVPAALIRGLRKTDIDNMFKTDRVLKEMFGR